MADVPVNQSDLNTSEYYLFQLNNDLDTFLSEYQKNYEADSKILADDRTALDTYRTEIKQSLTDIKDSQITLNANIVKLNDTISNGTTSTSSITDQNTIAINNTFDAITILIGVVLGIAVGITFLKGFVFEHG